MPSESLPPHSLFARIRAVVAAIPRGYVSTYGDIARQVGISDARKVGWAIYNNQDPMIPCHRVVNKDGYLAKKFSLGGWEEQRRRLDPEGVTFTQQDQVDLSKCRWMFPTQEVDSAL